MCILSYIPSRVGFTITFSRDEVYNRTSTAPELHNYKGQQLVFPKDNSSGGSWIGFNKTKSILGCILNNTGKSPNEPSKSRGLHLINQLVSDNGNLNDITLRDIAPFTQVFFHFQTKTIIQIDLDGLSLKKQNISMYSPFLICSNILYDQKTQTELKTHFINQISTNADEDVSSSFHKRNLFYRNHPIYLRKDCDIQTVSITKIVKNISGFTLEYKDVLNRKTEILQL